VVHSGTLPLASASTQCPAPSLFVVADDDGVVYSRPLIELVRRQPGALVSRSRTLLRRAAQGDRVERLHEL
jgi:hypothetical protein